MIVAIPLEIILQRKILGYKDSLPVLLNHVKVI